MRIRPLEDKEMKWSARVLLAYAKRPFGKVLTPWRVSAYRPSTLWSFTILSAVAARSNAADPSYKALVSLRTAQIVGCPF
jgi:alkylhydroperoxidase family enzyme